MSAMVNDILNRRSEDYNLNVNHSHVIKIN